jgi:hypothetical protein
MARTVLILEWNAPIRDFAIANRENACALRITTERHANVRFVPTIAQDVEFACRRRISRPCTVRRTPFLGTLTNILDASVMMGIVVRIALRRSARRGMIFSMVTELPRVATVRDVAIATMLPVFVDASRDTLETGASTKLFSVKQIAASLTHASL